MADQPKRLQVGITLQLGPAGQEAMHRVHDLIRAAHDRGAISAQRRCSLLEATEHDPLALFDLHPQARRAGRGKATLGLTLDLKPEIATELSARGA